MGDEATTTESSVSEVTTEAPAEAPSAEQQATEQAQESPSTPDYDIFGESVDESELMGTEETASDDATGEESENPAPEGEKTEGKDDANKPPKGFVPLEALQEERSRRRQAQERIQNQEARIRELLSQRQQASRVDTPVVTEEQISGASEDVQAFCRKYPQYAAIALEDSETGAQIRDQVESFGEAEAIKLASPLSMERALKARSDNEQAATATEAERQMSQAVVTEMDAMFDGGLNGTEARSLVQKLQDSGLSADAITVLTSPNTMVTDPRSGKRFRMGSVALQLVGAFKEAYDMAGKADPSALREQLTKEITEQVMRKMRGDDGTDSGGFRDIGSIPGHELPPTGRIPTSEAAFEKLTPEQQERLLMGDL